MVSNHFEIHNVRLADSNLAGRTLYTIRCQENKVAEIKLYDEGVRQFGDHSVDGRGGLLIPSQGRPTSEWVFPSPYTIKQTSKAVELDARRDFSEALRVTSGIKKSFKHEKPELYRRGDRLIRESLEAGVTVMRAHVEVDNIVGEACLETGIELKDEWSGVCDVQLALFMQDPLFENPTDSDPGENASVARQALENHAGSISAVGSAPYVERTREQRCLNIRFVLDNAMKSDLHVDFHLDYDLSPLPTDDHPEADGEPLVYYLLDELHKRRWTEHMPGRVITIGHATRLSQFSSEELHDLRRRIGSLPVYFVGLPQSDVYMMGRDSGQRGTLNVCKLGRDYELSVAMSVNNVANAFTPQGTPDPLGLCPLGVAVYQDGTLDGCRRLLEAVSTGSKAAIGVAGPQRQSLVPIIGSPADFVILHGNVNLPVQTAALSPSFDRTIIIDGRVVAWRESSKWNVRQQRMYT